MSDMSPKQLTETILCYYNRLCREENVYPLPCIMTTSKRTFKRTIVSIQQSLEAFKPSQEKTVLEGILKIATDYCDSPE